MIKTRTGKPLAKKRTKAEPLSFKRFAAIDFETADYGRDSACAVALVRVERNRIVDRVSSLIRPPRREFVFTYIHGITWEMVRDAPAFDQLWPELDRWMRGVRFLAAHNASFDRGVLEACCRSSGLTPPGIPFECTVRMARAVFGIYPTRLDCVCRALGIPLVHHRAESDAEACARIVLAARQRKCAT
jgi:DNA polymerase-3 subunit epsilon